MIAPFFLLLLIPSLSYGMDPESLTYPSSSTCKATQNDTEPLGGWITIPEDLFEGEVPKGTKVAPLEILQLPINSNPSLIYKTYAEGYHRFFHTGESVPDPEKKLILEVGKRLGLLAPDGTLIPRLENISSLTLADTIRCIQLFGLRKTKQEGEQIIKLVRSGSCNQEILCSFIHNSIVLSPAIKHQYKKYLWSLYVVLRSLHKTNNPSITINPQQQSELSSDLFKLTSNQITDKKAIAALCQKIPEYAIVNAPEIQKLFKDYATIVGKGLEGKNFCLYHSSTVLGTLIESMLADTKNPERYALAHTTLLTHNTRKLTHLLMPAPTVETTSTKPPQSKPFSLFRLFYRSEA